MLALGVDHRSSSDGGPRCLAVADVVLSTTVAAEPIVDVDRYARIQQGAATAWR